jgi:hypothetical protein
MLPNRRIRGRPTLPIVATSLLAALAFSACSDSGMGPDEPANAAPVIGSLSVVESSYRTARVTAAVTDADGTVTTVRIDWGDGANTTVPSGFGAVSQTHKYGGAQSYTVTVHATDDASGTAQLSKSVTIRVPPEVCASIEILELCASSTANFRNLNVAVRAGDIVLQSFTISDGQPAIVVPLALGWGRLSLAYNFDTGLLRIGGEVCVVAYFVCFPIAEHRIAF